MPSGTQSLRRIFIAVPAIIFASCLATASADPSSARAFTSVNSPSNFDYLVLASIADSPQLLAMSGYRSAGEQRSDPKLHPADYLWATHRLNMAAQRPVRVLASTW